MEHNDRFPNLNHYQSTSFPPTGAAGVRFPGDCRNASVITYCPFKHLWKNPSRGFAQRNHWLRQWSKTANASNTARLVLLRAPPAPKTSHRL
ncbi:MAG: hypothetical protein JXA18_07435, partial [Chitinispirillaceae bacterium]|nr:hypothetical protein [Chitinispirillaceae bacterium]